MDVDYDAKETTVVFDAAKTKPEQLIAAIVGAGFESSVKRGPSPAKETP